MNIFNWLFGKGVWEQSLPLRIVRLSNSLLKYQMLLRTLGGSM